MEKPLQGRSWGERLEPLPDLGTEVSGGAHAPQGEPDQVGKPAGLSWGGSLLWRDSSNAEKMSSLAGGAQQGLRWRGAHRLLFAGKVRLCLAQKGFGSCKEMSVGMGEDSVVADLVESPGEHMLEKSSDELLGRKGHHFPGIFSRVFVAESDPTIIDGKDAAVGDGNPVHIAGKIVEDLLRPLHTRLAVDHPIFFPDGVREHHLRESLSGKLHEPGTEDLGEGSDRHQKAFPGGNPPGAIQTSSRDKTVDVRMIDHGSGPGMHNRENADLPSNVVGIESELHEGVGCRLAERIEKDFLVSPDQLTKLPGEGKDQVKIEDRQEGLPALLDPLPSVLSMAFGAVAVAAGVIGIVHLSTLIALEEMTPKSFCAAIHEVPQSTDVAWEHSVSELLDVLRAIEPEDFGKLRHERLASDKLRDRSSDN